MRPTAGRLRFQPSRPASSLPIKRRTSAERTQASQRADTQEEPLALIHSHVRRDPHQCNAVRRMVSIEPVSTVPLALPLTSGRSFRTTQVGINAAHRLTRREWQTREHFRQKFTLEEFTKVSFTAIGETIQNMRVHLPKESEDPNVTLVDGTFYAALVNAVERAYRRTDLLQQRRGLSEAWARHCEPRGAGDEKIVELRKAY